MNNDYNVGGTVVAKTYPGTPGPSRPGDIAPSFPNPAPSGPGDIAPSFPNPAPSGPGDIAPYNPGQTGGFGTGGGADEVSNFSVLKLEEILKQLKDKFYELFRETACAQDYALTIAHYVTSADSNLGGAWTNVGNAIEKFKIKFKELEDSYNTEISKYVEETVALEMSTALNVEEVSEEINDISSQLDSLFGM